MHSGRTLYYESAKKVECVAQSLSSITHSYTIQPTVPAEGMLLSPLFIVLKEKAGTFGPRVIENLFIPTNVRVEASTSGKLSKELFQTWIQEIFLPQSGDSPVLSLDSWSGQCEKIVREVIPLHVNLQLKIIPKGTTGMIQPLDVYGFRLWKNFVRRFSDIVAWEVKDYNSARRVRRLQLGRFVFSLVFELRIAVEIGEIQAFIHHIIISQCILFCKKVNFINYFISITYI